MANAAKKIRQTFINRQVSLTLKDLRFENAELKPNEISIYRRAPR